MPSFAKARASGKAGPGSLAADPVATLRRQGGAARAAQRGVIAPKTADRVLLAEREEPVQQTALVHHLDAAHVQAERADHPGRLRLTSAWTPCSRNSLASIMPVGPPPATTTSIMKIPTNEIAFRPAVPRNPPTCTPATERRVPAAAWRVPPTVRSPRDTRVDKADVLRESLIYAGSGFGCRFCSTTRVLPQVPGALYTLKVARSGQPPCLCLLSSTQTARVTPVRP
jgi:hypothetical protein